MTASCSMCSLAVSAIEVELHGASLHETAASAGARPPLLGPWLAVGFVVVSEVGRAVLRGGHQVSFGLIG